jgi:hypothetical protein
MWLPMHALMNAASTTRVDPQPELGKAASQSPHVHWPARYSLNARLCTEGYMVQLL